MAMFSKKKIQSESGDLPEHVELVKSWLEKLLCESEPSDFFLQAVEAKRVSLDSDTEKFSIVLLKPIQLENGERVSIVTIGEADVGMIRRATYSNKEDFGTGVDVMALASGVPKGVFERIKSRDLKIISEAYSFFG
jgi:hypothetical protein